MFSRFLRGKKKISKSKLGIVVLSLVGVCRIHLHSLFLTNKYKKVHKKKKFKYSLFSLCLHSFQSSISPHHSEADFLWEFDVILLALYDCCLRAGIAQ